jgi:anti-sigma factor RsiW
MNCDAMYPYLPGYAGSELRPETAATVERHLTSCKTCSAEIAVLQRARAGLANLVDRPVEPPAYLVDAVLESVQQTRARRLAPIPPLPAAELVKVVVDNRDAIASAAGTALLAAGAAYALWRAVKGSRRAQPATG